MAPSQFNWPEVSTDKYRVGVIWLGLALEVVDVSSIPQMLAIVDVAAYQGIGVVF